MKSKHTIIFLIIIIAIVIGWVILGEKQPAKTAPATEIDSINKSGTNGFGKP